MADIDQKILQIQEAITRIGGAMPPADHLSGLLHLGAIAVGVAAVYLGIDRIRSEPDVLLSELKQQEVVVGDLLKQFDTTPADMPTLSEIYSMPEMQFLCYVAKKKIPITRGLRIRTAHLRSRSRRAPCLWYFRNRGDRKLVTVVGGIATLLFLLLTAATVWPRHLEWVHRQPLLDGSFIGFSALLAWIFYTVSASYRLRRLADECAKCAAVMRVRLDDLKKDAIREVAESTLSERLKRRLHEIAEDSSRDDGPPGGYK